MSYRATDRGVAASEIGRSALALLADARRLISEGRAGGRGLALVGVGEALCSLALSAERIADALAVSAVDGEGKP